MAVETFRTNFYQNGVSEFAVKHFEECTSVWRKIGLLDIPKCFLDYILLLCDILYKTLFLD